MEAHNAPHILSVPPHALAESGIWSYVTNTVVSTWIFVLIVAVCGVFLHCFTRQIRFCSYNWISHCEAFEGIFEPLLGHNLPIHKTLWFVGGVFIYILGSNLYSLLLDWLLAFSPETWHDYLRPINSDINTTLGMAVLMIIISHMIMIRFRGVIGYVLHYVFNFSGHGIVDKFINVVVGWLHIIGEVVRIMALSLRLFGNIFAGAVLLESCSGSQQRLALQHSHSEISSLSHFISLKCLWGSYKRWYLHCSYHSTSKKRLIRIIKSLTFYFLIIFYEKVSSLSLSWLPPRSICWRSYCYCWKATTAVSAFGPLGFGFAVFASAIAIGLIGFQLLQLSAEILALQKKSLAVSSSRWSSQKVSVSSLLSLAFVKNNSVRFLNIFSWKHSTLDPCWSKS